MTLKTVFWSTISSDPETSAAWEQGLSGGVNSVDPARRAQFTVIANRLIFLFQNVHYQRRKGVVDDELWDAWLASLDEFLALPGFHEVLE